MNLSNTVVLFLSKNKEKKNGSFVLSPISSQQHSFLEIGQANGTIETVMHPTKH